MHVSQLNGHLKECFDGARKELRGLQRIRVDDRLAAGDTLQLLCLDGLPQPNLRGRQAHWNCDLLSPVVCQQVRELVQANMIGILVMGEAATERGNRQDDSAPDVSDSCEFRRPTV